MRGQLYYYLLSVFLIVLIVLLSFMVLNDRINLSEGYLVSGGAENTFTDKTIQFLKEATKAIPRIEEDEFLLLQPACGNGLMNGGEFCDDGNTNSGDGCSSSCKIERNYICRGSPAVCQEIRVEFTEIASGLKEPLWITHSPDGTGRLFVVERGESQIRILEEGANRLNDEAFLEISEITYHPGEPGLVSMAFHPDYATNGKLYIFHIDKDVNNVVAEYTVEGDPRTATSVDYNSRREIFKIYPVRTSHNTIGLAFGPFDGYLYVSMGDGFTTSNAQDMSNPFGSVMRLDVDSQEIGDYGLYGIPPDNPYVGVSGKSDEIWAHGFRQIWKITFDRETGDMFVADVGEDKNEEVNYIEKGKNYGWGKYEGECSGSESECDKYTDAVHTLRYGNGETQGRSILAGVVYRGHKYPVIDGVHVYADHYSGTLWAMNEIVEGKWVYSILDYDDHGGDIRQMAHFGETEEGEIVMVTRHEDRDEHLAYRLSVSGVECGNNVIEVGEQCDDGNDDNWDGCTNDCQEIDPSEQPVCGNNKIENGEFCDGNRIACQINGESGTQTCNSVCDGYSGCVVNTLCGNGFVNTGEECDDGNIVDGDGCSVICELEDSTIPTNPCGNGIVDTGETCDDGNIVEGDGCSAVCQIETAVCGNGIWEVGEECDDGNIVDGDGCSAICKEQAIQEEDNEEDLTEYDVNTILAGVDMIIPTGTGIRYSDEIKGDHAVRVLEVSDKDALISVSGEGEFLLKIGDSIDIKTVRITLISVNFKEDYATLRFKETTSPILVVNGNDDKEEEIPISSERSGTIFVIVVVILIIVAIIVLGIVIFKGFFGRSKSSSNIVIRV
jgi:cysteine-rich repeat protein